ncbi:MAG: DUF5362 family protein [Ferruginibacter sp.]
MENTNDLLQNDLTIDTDTAGNMKESAMWGRFLGIMGFIYSGLISIMAVFMGWFFERIMPRSAGITPAAAIGGIFIGVIYFVMAVMVFFLSLYLFKFGSKAQAALKANDQESLRESFKNLKLYFRVLGIITIISLVLMGLGIIGSLITAAFNT